MGEIELSRKSVLCMAFMVSGIIMILSFINFQKVDRIGVKAFEEGLVSGFTFTSARLLKTDIIEFGKMRGPAELTVTITAPSSGEPNFFTSAEWKSRMNLTTIQDNLGNAFAAPYDGNYDILIDNYGLPQEDFRVWILRTRKEVALLYGGSSLLAISAIIGILISIRVTINIRRR